MGFDNQQVLRKSWLNRLSKVYCEIITNVAVTVLEPQPSAARALQYLPWDRAHHAPVGTDIADEMRKAFTHADEDPRMVEYVRGFLSRYLNEILKEVEAAARAPPPAYAPAAPVSSSRSATASSVPTASPSTGAPPAASKGTPATPAPSKSAPAAPAASKGAPATPAASQGTPAPRATGAAGVSSTSPPQTYICGHAVVADNRRRKRCPTCGGPAELGGVARGPVERVVGESALHGAACGCQTAPPWLLAFCTCNPIKQATHPF